MASGAMTGTGSWEFLTTIALASIYIILGGFRVLLIKLSANQDGKFDFLPVSVNLCAELIKLLVCCVLALNTITKERLKSCSSFLFSIYDVLRLLKWSIPGLLYFLDNLIAFYVVAAFEPAMVVLLNNFVIISTAVLFRVILKRKLMKVQWASLVILFLAIVSLSQHSHAAHTQSNTEIVANLKKTNESKLKSAQQIRCIAEGEATDQCNMHGLTMCSNKQTKWHVLYHIDNISFIGQYQGYIWVILQCFVSSLANIYNEKIFKEGKGFEDSIYIQNTKLYFFGVLVNFLSIVFIDKFWQHTNKCGLFNGFNIFSTLLVLDSAFMGLTISLILKFRDNMFHVLSAQLVTVLVITFSVVFMDFQLSMDFFLHVPVVLLAIYIFNLSKQDSELPSHRNRTHSTSDNTC